MHICGTRSFIPTSPPVRIPFKNDNCHQSHLCPYTTNSCRLGRANHNVLPLQDFYNPDSSLHGMSALLLVFITRINGVEMAGIFSFASAISYQCLSLGAFGVRNFQSSDVNCEYKFYDYFNLRVFSSILIKTPTFYTFLRIFLFFP